MSIVRVGLSESTKFAAGYEAIFGKTKPSALKPKARRKMLPRKKSAKRK